VSLLRTINRIGAHYLFINFLIRKTDRLAAVLPLATQQCALARWNVRDPLTTPLIRRFKLVRSIDPSDL
jgi:hypothetical protein